MPRFLCTLYTYSTRLRLSFTYTHSFGTDTHTWRFRPLEIGLFTLHNSRVLGSLIESKCFICQKRTCWKIKNICRYIFLFFSGCPGRNPPRNSVIGQSFSSKTLKLAPSEVTPILICITLKARVTLTLTVLLI